MIKNTDQSYGSIAKFFHWFMAIAIICLLAGGFLFDRESFPFLFKAHKTIGFLILTLAIARLLWRFGNIVPSYDNKFPKIMTLAAHSAHYILYALMIMMPLSAFISSNANQYPVSFLFLFDMPSFFSHKDVELAKSMMQIHKFLALVLIFFISVHILAALYHHFIKKDNVLTRMLPSFFTKI